MVSGTAIDGSQVVGKAYEDYPAGSSAFGIQYQTSDSQSNYVNCQVGGLSVPNTQGCFEATGNVTIEGAGSVGYTYNPLTDNNNGRTIQGFSTEADEKMNTCANCPYKTFKMFRDYYGASDYADKWVTAAFAGEATNFNNGNADFSLYSCAGQQEAIKKATAYMNTYMYVIREMEDAYDDCKEACTIENCNDDPVHAWDEAVAFYTGTLEGTDGSGSGVQMHSLADKRCANFATCTGDDPTEGSSKVNKVIFDHFKIGKSKLLQGQCQSVREDINIIENLMSVGVTQGAIRYAYITDKNFGNDVSEKAEAEGATFAAAVLPIVNFCDPSAAQTIYDNLKVGQGGSANYPAVKSAFESVYSCMNITCADVGGLYDPVTGSYQEGAAPCADASTQNQGSGASSMTLTSLFGLAVVIAAALV
jgi:Low iron-inducible periplasmic protein